MKNFRAYRFFPFLLAFLIIFVSVGCREEKTPWQVEKYGTRQVICLNRGNPPTAYLKFEFNYGQNLSAVYWQKNADFGYLWDVKSQKIFIDASSGLFFRTASNFYESLDRDIDIGKIKDSLTKGTLEEFARAIEDATMLAVASQGAPGVINIVRQAEEAVQAIRRIDPEPWYCAVEAEQNKIHALGLEYCISKDAAEKLLSRTISEDAADYPKIIADRMTSNGQFVVCLGENHPEDADKAEAMRLLRELRPAGFDYFLVECVLDSDQKILDDYRPDDAAARAKLLQYLDRTGWSAQSMKFGGRGSEPYVEAIDLAIRLGYKVVAIAPPQRDDIESCRYHYYMALNVVKVLRSDCRAKIIVFAGATHCFPNRIPKSQVVLEGYLMRQDIPDTVRKLAEVESVSFRCIGGLKDAEIRPYLNPQKVLEKHIENKGWAEKRFFIPVPPEISTLSPEAAYYFIHLPQYRNKR